VLARALQTPRRKIAATIALSRSLASDARRLEFTARAARHTPSRPVADRVFAVAMDHPNRDTAPAIGRVGACRTAGGGVPLSCCNLAAARVPGNAQDTTATSPTPRAAPLGPSVGRRPRPSARLITCTVGRPVSVVSDDATNASSRFATPAVVSIHASRLSPRTTSARLVPRSALRRTLGLRSGAVARPPSAL